MPPVCPASPPARPLMSIREAKSTSHLPNLASAGQPVRGDVEPRQGGTARAFRPLHRPSFATGSFTCSSSRVKRLASTSSAAFTRRPCSVVTLPMRLTTTYRISTGRPRQLLVMWQNIRCSILFHLLVHGGKWQTLTSRAGSSMQHRCPVLGVPRAVRGLPPRRRRAPIRAIHHAGRCLGERFEALGYGQATGPGGLQRATLSGGCVVTSNKV
jgi:hypothetical protein